MFEWFLLQYRTAHAVMPLFRVNSIMVDFVLCAGATWVAVEPLLNQATLNASIVVISPDGTTDDALITYIRAAKSLGLSVMIKV